MGSYLLELDGIDVLMRWHWAEFHPNRWRGFVLGNTFCGLMASNIVIDTPIIMRCLLQTTENCCWLNVWNTTYASCLGKK